MPGKGFPPQPTAIKLLRGNPGRRPLNRREPKALVGQPVAPAWLTESDSMATPLEVYDELAALLEPLQVLTVADQQALASLADKIALYRRLRVEIYSGFTYETQSMAGSMMRRSKPEVGPFLDLARQIEQGYACFGLTPSSRTKVQTVGPEQKSGLEEFLGSGT